MAVCTAGVGTRGRGMGGEGDTVVALSSQPAKQGSEGPRDVSIRGKCSRHGVCNAYRAASKGILGGKVCIRSLPEQGIG